MNAAAVTDANIQWHRQIKAQAARLGFNYRIGEKVDPVELDRCLAGRDVSARLALKTNLMRAGVLSAND